MTGEGCLLRGAAAVGVALILSQLNVVVPVPVAPAYLWPVPLAMLGIGLVPRRWWRMDSRKPVPPAARQEADREEPATPHARQSSGLHGLLGLPILRALHPASLVLGAVGCLCLAHFSVPPVRGVIRDEATGEPISGATVYFSAWAKRLQNLESGTGNTRFGPVRRCVSDERGRFAFWGLVALFPVGISPFSVIRGAGFDFAVMTVLHPAYGAGYGQVTNELQAEYESIFADTRLRFGYACGFEWDGSQRRIRVSIRCKPRPRRADGAVAVSRDDAIAFLDGWSHLTQSGDMMSLQDFARLAEAQAAVVPLDEEMIAVIARTRDRAIFEPFRPSLQGDGQGSDECLRLVEEYCRRNPSSRPCASRGGVQHGMGAR